MDFREYATKEAAASLRRAYAGSAEVCKQQLASLRTAFENAAKALESAAHPSDAAERDFAEFIDRLSKAAAAAAQAAADAAAKRASDEARTAHDALRADLQKLEKEATEAKAAAAATLKQSQVQADALRGELATAKKGAETAAQELAGVREAAKKLDAERRDLASARDAEKTAKATAEGELHKTRDLLEKSRAELTAISKKLETTKTEKTVAEDAVSVANSQAEAAEAKLAAVTDLLNKAAARAKVLERAHQDHEQAMRELQARVQQAPPPGADGARSVMSAFDDLLGAYQALAAAGTIADVLTTLAEQLAVSFTRVAVFRVKSNHLQGERHIGFDLKTDISKVVMPLGMDSVLSRAAASGDVERLSAEELADSSRVPFSGSPGCAVALPVTIDAEVMAVVYADDAGDAKARGAGAANTANLRVHFADALRQYAQALIARMRNELKALAELRAYAESLINEIEGMHAADLAAEIDDVQQRLKVNLEYARSVYANRVALESADAGGLLEDAIEAAASVHPQTPFSRDLGVVSGHAKKGQKRAGQAS